MAQLQQPKFAEAVYITGYNHSANQYALSFARAYAARTSAQLLWIQAEDRPPYAYFGDKSKSELQKIKRT